MSEKRIREAMDARLSGMAASAARRMRLAQSARAGGEKTHKVRKGVTAALIVAALIAGSVAVGAGLNLFTYLSGDHPQLKEYAETALVTDNPVVTIIHEKIGTIEAGITNAYFDGGKLMVGRFLNNYGWTQYGWIPTGEMLARMTLLEENPYAAALAAYSGSAGEPEEIEALRRAVESGTAWGVETYSVYWSAEQADGETLDYSDNWYEIISEPKPRLYEVIEYRPLPEDVRKRNELRLNQTLQLTALFRYYDGRNWYEYRSEAIVGEMTAVVKVTKQ